MHSYCSGKDLVRTGKHRFTTVYTCRFCTTKWTVQRDPRGTILKVCKSASEIEMNDDARARVEHDLGVLERIAKGNANAS